MNAFSGLHYNLNSTVTACLVLVVTGAVFAFFRQGTLGQLAVPPGAKWIWGHEQIVFMNEPGRAYRDWINVFGLTFRIKAAFGAPDVLVLSDPEGISHILQKKIYDYHHSKLVRPRVARFLGKGLGWVEGEDEHKRMRRLASPSLSSENIKAMSDDVKDATATVVNELTQQVQGQGGRPATNILDWTNKATLNVIGRVIFSHDFEGGNSEEARQMLNARQQGVSPIARYAGFLTLMLLRRFPILNDLPISVIQAQSMLKTTIQSGAAREMVKRNQDLVKNHDKKPKDLLSRLLTAENEGKISTTELYEQISTFVVAGHESTAQTIGFTVWELARNPAMQQKLREELEQFSGEPTYDDFQARLPYLDAVLRETLRLYPALPYMERVATKPDVIPLRQPVKLRNGKSTNEIVVRPGQTVLIPIIAIHRLDSVWDCADEFRPDRWLGKLPPSELLCNGWSNTLAFSDGPRNCIGTRLAIFQYKVILTALIARFRFHDPGTQITLKIASSLQPWVVGEKEKGAQLLVNLELI